MPVLCYWHRICVLRAFCTFFDQGYYLEGTFVKHISRRFYLFASTAVFGDMKFYSEAYWCFGPVLPSSNQRSRERSRNIIIVIVIKHSMHVQAHYNEHARNRRGSSELCMPETARFIISISNLVAELVCHGQF